MIIKVNNRRGIFGVFFDPISRKSRCCGCTRSLQSLKNGWGYWAIETHTLLRNKIGLK